MNTAPEQASHILLVDDDHDVLGAYARFLRLNAMQVTVADQPSRALHVLNEQPLDLVITDLRMPSMSGLEFAKSVRATNPLLPILFISGYAKLTDVVTAMRLGAIDFVEKPIEPDLLLQQVQDIIAPRQRTAALQRIAFELDDLDVPYKARVQAYERYLIEHAFATCDGRVSNVLEKLQINRRTLNDKMSKLGLSRRGAAPEE
ncbi:MAG: response regulator [Pseudomonadota bacterium]